MKNNFHLLVLSCIFSAFILEGASRVYQYGLDGLLPHIIDSTHSLGESGLIQASDNLDILYELKPNLNTYFKKVRFLTNTQGLRDKNYAIQKSGSVFRVAVIGDSLTMPAGVAIEDSYHSILEKRLSSENPNKPIEFINFGVGGYNLKQYTAVFEHKAMAYKPDFVLIGFCTANDWYSKPNPLRPYQVKPVAHPFFKSSFMAWIRRIFRSSDTREDLGQLSQSYLDGEFSRIRELSLSKGVPVAVVALGIKPMTAKQSIFLRRVVEKNHLLYLDATQPFKGLSSASFQIYRADPHPNSKANQIFAEQIYVFLKSALSLKA